MNITKNNLNTFIDQLFQDYWSISPERFESQCKLLGRDPQKAKQYLLSKKLVRIIANGHIEFIGYELN